MPDFNILEVVFEFPFRVIRDGTGCFIPIERHMHALVNGRHGKHGDICVMITYYLKDGEYVPCDDRALLKPGRVEGVFKDGLFIKTDKNLYFATDVNPVDKDISYGMQMRKNADGSLEILSVSQIQSSPRGGI